jgi:hypothetical protein
MWICQQRNKSNRTRAGTLKEAQPENFEGVSRVNGMAINKAIVVVPDEPQTTMSNHLQEGTVENVMGWPKWYAEVCPNRLEHRAIHYCRRISNRYLGHHANNP